MKNSHQTKSKKEFRNFVNELKSKTDEPTISEKGESTLDNTEQDNKTKPLGKNQKFPQNRIFKYIKTHWVSFLITGILTIVGTISLFLFRDVNIKLAEINKDLGYHEKEIAKNNSDIDNLSKNINQLQTETTSLNDRFIMFIELFRNNNETRNNP